MVNAWSQAFKNEFRIIYPKTETYAPFSIYGRYFILLPEGLPYFICDGKINDAAFKRNFRIVI